MLHHSCRNNPSISLIIVYDVISGYAGCVMHHLPSTIQMTDVSFWNDSCLHAVLHPSLPYWPCWGVLKRSWGSPEHPGWTSRCSTCRSTDKTPETKSSVSTVSNLPDTHLSSSKAKTVQNWYFAQIFSQWFSFLSVFYFCLSGKPPKLNYVTQNWDTTLLLFCWGS